MVVIHLFCLVKFLKRLMVTLEYIWNSMLQLEVPVLLVKRLQVCDSLKLKRLGNLKTLTPSLRTPATDRFLGLPYGPVHGLPLRTPSMDHPKNRVKVINKDLTYWSSIIDTRIGEILVLKCANVTDLARVQVKSLHIAISFAVVT